MDELKVVWIWGLDLGFGFLMIVLKLILLSRYFIIISMSPSVLES